MTLKPRLTLLEGSLSGKFTNGRAEQLSKLLVQLEPFRELLR